MGNDDLFSEEFFNTIYVEIANEIQNLLKTTTKQVEISSTAHATSKEEPRYIFTSKFYDKAHEAGLTEDDALYVYNTGQQRSKNIAVREYNGYELGIKHEIDPRSGKPKFTSIWKTDISR